MTVVVLLNPPRVCTSPPRGQTEYRAIVPAAQHALPIAVPPVVYVKPKSCNHAWLNQLSISNTQRERKRRAPMLFDSLIDQQIPLCHFSRSCGNCHSRLNPWVIWYLETLRQLSVNIWPDHARLALSASHRNQSEFRRASSIKHSMIRLLISSIIEPYCNLSLSNVSNVWITHYQRRFDLRCHFI